ncbi:hypothetical protein OAB43_02385 [Bacteroidia bacterium]|nr:hypothetical protein [Bacteroidia bacterium]
MIEPIIVPYFVSSFREFNKVKSYDPFYAYSEPEETDEVLEILDITLKAELQCGYDTLQRFIAVI